MVSFIGGMTLAFFILFGNMPVWNEQVKRFPLNYPFKNDHINAITISRCFIYFATVFIIYISFTAVRDIELKFICTKLSFCSSDITGSGICYARSGPILTKNVLNLLITLFILYFSSLSIIKYLG